MLVYMLLSDNFKFHHSMSINYIYNSGQNESRKVNLNLILGVCSFGVVHLLCSHETAWQLAVSARELGVGTTWTIYLSLTVRALAPCGTNVRA